jgi:hypothetical protein
MYSAILKVNQAEDGVELAIETVTYFKRFLMLGQLQET